MKPDDNQIVVLVTAPDEETAERIARTLVEGKLAACVNLLAKISSIYRWEGEIQQDQEVLMIIKTRSEIVESRLIPKVKQLHPYDVPEILSLPIVAGNQAYLDWIRSETTID